MRWFLQGYYGYRNFGDELLLLGVIEYILSHRELSELLIEVQDRARSEHRLDMHSDLLTPGCLDKVRFLQQWQYDRRHLTGTLKFFGGGEVLTDQVTSTAGHPIRRVLWRLVARAGRNYVARHYRSIAAGQFVLLGGITQPYRHTTRALYRYLLPKAQQIILRDPVSYQIASQYSAHITQHHDFALPIMQRIHQTRPFQIHTGRPYILINLHPKIRHESTRQRLQDFLIDYPDHTVYYFPCDMGVDLWLFADLQEIAPHAQLYDWTEHDLYHTIGFIRQATAGIGARLHFLLALHECIVPSIPLVYADKVTKVLSSISDSPDHAL